MSSNYSLSSDSEESHRYSGFIGDSSLVVFTVEGATRKHSVLVEKTNLLSETLSHGCNLSSRKLFHYLPIALAYCAADDVA